MFSQSFRIAAPQAFECAGTDLDPGQRRGFLVAAEGRQVTMFGSLEELGRGYGPRGMGANDLATDETFGFRRVFNLLGHGHPISSVEQLSEVAVKGVVRDSAHRCVHGIVLPATGESDAEHRSGLLRILEEELVEVSHAVEQQRRSRLFLEIEVLAQHRGHFHLGLPPPVWSIIWSTVGIPSADAVQLC